MLKTTCSVCLLILLCSGSVLAVQKFVEWSKLESAQGRFSALMPSQPEPETRDVDSAVGRLTLYSFSASNKTGYFMISYADYPNEPASANQERVLDGVTGGVIKGLQAELITETKMSFKGYPSREFRARRIFEGNEVVFTWKTVLVGRRLYQIGVATNKIDVDSADLQKFFTSFQLVN